MQEATSDRFTALCVTEAGDVRESRLGFGCQPVFSAIISSRVSRNVPADPCSVSLTWPLRTGS